MYKVNTLLYGILMIVLLISCGEDTDGGIDPVDCESLSISSSTITAFDSVFVSQVEGIYDIEFWQEGAYTDISMVLETADDGRRFFLAPLNPNDVLASGTFDVRFVHQSSSVVCHEERMMVGALPPAPGYSARVGAAMHRLIVQRADALGVSSQSYENTAFSGDLAALPFFVAYNVIGNMDSELSFNSFISNDAMIDGYTDDKEVTVALLDALLSSSGLLSAIEEDINTFEDRVGMLRDVSTDDTVRDACDGLTDNMIAAEFRIVQDARSYSDPNGAKFLRFKDALNKIGLAGLIPGAGTASASIGMFVWAYQKLYEGIENVYLSEVLDAQLIFEKTNFLEEEACDDLPWPTLEIYVANKGWNLSTSKFELALQTVGLLASFKGWNTKYTETLAGAGVMAGSAVLTDLQSQLGPDGANVERVVCGPIQVSNENTYGKVASGDAVTVDNASGIISPYKVGTATVEFGLVSLTFGGVQSSATELITITGPSITWLPAGTINANTNEILNLEAYLINNLLVDVLISSEHGSTSTPEVFLDDEITTYEIEHTTPSDPSLFPYHITIEYQSDLCLRGTDQSTPVFGTVRITNGASLRIITPNQPCYEAGNEIDLDVVADGSISDDVNWSVTFQDGSFPMITPDGRFTPEKNGEYYVQAQLAEDEMVTDSTFILVSDCNCQFIFESNFTVRSGLHAEYASAFGLNSIGGNEGDFDIAFQFFGINFPSEGETLTVSLGAEEIFFLGNSGSFIFNSFVEEGTIHEMTMTNVEGNMIGKISGPTSYYTEDDPTPVITSMSFSFIAGFSDPLQGIEACE